MMRAILQLPIRFYRLFISPMLPQMCRFQPSCSEYGIEAIGQHGMVRGSYLTARRIMRCHPWGRSGFDPVPACPDKGCTRGPSDLNTQHTHSSGHQGEKTAL